MKSFLILSFSLILLLVGSVAMAQQPTVPVEQTPVYTYMFWSALLGVIARVIVSAIKGVKNNPNSPDKFDITYWLTDNVSAKIKVFLSFVLSFTFLDQFKLTQTTWGIILLCAVALSAGWALDWVAEFIDKIKKFKPKPAV